MLFLKYAKICPGLASMIFNERKLVLELLNLVKVKVKVTMKKFRNRLLLPESLDDL